MENITQKPKLPLWILPAAVAAAAAAQLFSVLYLIVPALIAATLMYTDRPSALFLLALPGYGLAYVLFSYAQDAFISALCMASLGVVPGLVLLYMQKTKKSGFHTAAVTAAACIAALYLAVCLPGVISGDGAFAAAKLYGQEMAAYISDTFASAIETMPELAESLSAYAPILEELDEMIVMLLVPMVCLIGCVLGVANTLFFRLFVRRNREALGLAPMRPLRDWTIPREYTVGITVMLVGSLLLVISETEFADSVGLTAMTLASFPMFIQALALIDWFIVQKGTRVAFKRTLMGILIVALFNHVVSILVTLGCFEQLFRARERIRIIRIETKPPTPTDKEEDK